MIDSSKDKSMKLMAFGALMVMFIMGGVVGILGTNWYNRTHPQIIPSNRPNKDGHDGGRRPGPPNGGPNVDNLIGKLTRDLGLTDQQAKQMKEIMMRTQDQFMQLRNESRPKYIAIREQSEKDIKAILTPEQQAKLDTIFKGERERGDRGDRERGDRGDRDRDHDKDKDKEGSQRPH